MDFNQALNQIQKHYEIRPITNDVFQIFTNLKINEFNSFFIVIKNSSKPFLTDYGKTFELVNCTEEEIKLICKKYNVCFNNYNLECAFTNIDDIQRLLNCILEITKSLS